MGRHDAAVHLPAVERHHVDTDAGLDRQGARTLLTAMSGAAHLFQLSRPIATLRRLYEEEPRWHTTPSDSASSADEQAGHRTHQVHAETSTRPPPAAA
jgi:hypothetical protein